MCAATRMNGIWRKNAFRSIFGSQPNWVAKIGCDDEFIIGLLFNIIPKVLTSFFSMNFSWSSEIWLASTEKLLFDRLLLSTFLLFVKSSGIIVKSLTNDCAAIEFSWSNADDSGETRQLERSRHRGLIFNGRSRKAVRRFAGDWTRKFRCSLFCKLHFVLCLFW